jgi:hypothetical protein
MKWVYLTVQKEGRQVELEKDLEASRRVRSQEVGRDLGGERAGLLVEKADGSTQLVGGSASVSRLAKSEKKRVSFADVVSQRAWNGTEYERL